MSEPVRVALVGATGLIGRSIIEESIGRRDDVQIVAIARREMKLPQGAKMEMVIAEPANWGEVLGVVMPNVLISALGTTWKRAGKSESAFRAVDYDLVLDTARAAVKLGIEHMVSVSSAGANPASKNLYLRVKGEAERDLSKVGFKRLDLLQPGLLRGSRERDIRFGEGFARAASPLIDPLMRGKWRAYRSIKAETVADGALKLASRKAAGRFTHDNESIWRAARDWAKRAA
ncbi:NAD(P)H-binding protein [Altererythrobacter sp.]|uniref:NAD(P)H-binding protein n=1 Tax=Altererythrobacter sp. TaxID=1872480 RepID=UPI003D027F08